jgi:uncharacterized protein YjbI with pentapeptide repeats
MANPDHVAQIEKGVAAWNAWRDENPTVLPDLSGASLNRTNLGGANLRRVDLSEAELNRASLSEAKLNGANLFKAKLSGAVLRRADLVEANLNGANLGGADLNGANLLGAFLNGAYLFGVNLSGAANLSEANLNGAELTEANLHRADLSYGNLSGADLNGADLSLANLYFTDLRGANLRGTELHAATLVNTDLTDADLTGCRIYGVSTWGVKLEGAKQQNLIITPSYESDIAIDDLKVAQFVYLLLDNENIRDVIDTIGKKGVLLLGRFTNGRIQILERLRQKLRELGYVPIVFNFDKPKIKDFTETVQLLAGLSHFVIADITNPRSAPLELQLIVPNCMIPLVPIIEEGEKPFAMFADLWIKYRDWVFEPIYYSSLDRLIEALDTEIIKPAEVRFGELIARKAEEMKGKHI